MGRFFHGAIIRQTLVGVLVAGAFFVAGCKGEKNPTAPAATADNAAIQEKFPRLKLNAEGYWDLDFELLASFPMEAPTTATALTQDVHAVVPEKFFALDGARVRVLGYMLPLAWNRGQVSEFLILRSPDACCFGVMPLQNEWIYAKATGEGFEEKNTEPQWFYGTFHVTKSHSEHIGAGIYQMTCERAETEY